MGWSLGYDEKWKRDIGHGVPAYCDHPGCGKEIDRGLAYVCGGQPYGGEYGWRLYFFGNHLFMGARRPQRCARCKANGQPFTPSSDHLEWIAWKLTDESWQQWREENPELVAALQLKLPRQPCSG